MLMEMNVHTLIQAGLEQETAEALLQDIKTSCHGASSPAEAWHMLSQHHSISRYPFALQRQLFTSLFPHWQEHLETAPAWLPTPEIIQNANITAFMSKNHFTDIQRFHDWTTHEYNAFWKQVIKQLNIQFKKAPEQISDLSHGIETPHWLEGAEMNIADSCFNASPTQPALIYVDQTKTWHTLSYAELDQRSNQIANSLCQQGYGVQDAIAIAMPMNFYAIAIYLGIIKMGGVVVSIADSFSSAEMQTRLKIAKAKLVFTQDWIDWDGKQLPLYQKLCATEIEKAIVIPCHDVLSLSLRTQDCAWSDFLVEDSSFTTVACEPMAACNILFSSGTTGEPKAIPWNHTTAIKAASDAYFHQNIKTNDVLAWPTNLGWMMGPWLIFAALINGATMALYPNAPKGRAFGEFIAEAKVTMLGVVPTLVATWRQSQCMENLDWSHIKVFSSTGECSNAEDMLYLMSLANYKPVIEYCGGTEIGGAYASSTVIQNNYPSLFSTPTMGLNFVILNEEGQLADLGEVAIIPPALGLSTQLLNADHHQVYFANMPMSLRRHGDQMCRLPNHYYCILGRADDTMNLGGIKISAAEIERTIAGIPQIIEVAAIAISPPLNGPSQLVIYAATKAKLDKKNIQKEMQQRINSHLNPLFKIHEVVFIDELPKTASNKIMRRVLRKSFTEKK